jgi:predicted GIY-YIG superfamily endonuclease
MIGSVYKIQSDCASIVYIGSTIQKLTQRFSSHKKKYQRTTISKYLNVELEMNRY